MNDKVFEEIDKAIGMLAERLQTECADQGSSKELCNMSTALAELIKARAAIVIHTVRCDAHGMERPIRK